MNYFVNGRQSRGRANANAISKHLVRAPAYARKLVHAHRATNAATSMANSPENHRALSAWL
eukprot:7854333-Lingulodinium_polyedra.AAC.1